MFHSRSRTNRQYWTVLQTPNLPLHRMLFPERGEAEVYSGRNLGSRSFRCVTVATLLLSYLFVCPTPSVCTRLRVLGKVA